MKFLRESIASLLSLAVLLLCVACTDPLPEGPNNGEEDTPTVDEPTEEPYEDITVVDGKVRFYLKERANSTRTATELTARDWAKSTVEMNGATYNVSLTDEPTPRPYIEVPEADSYKATLLTSTSANNYIDSSRSKIKLPYSQFYHTSTTTIKSFPMYASYSTETGNKLIFNDPFAMIYLQLKGTAKVTSIKVENLSEEALAGISSLTAEYGLAVTRGVDFAVLNTTNKGNCVQLLRSKSSHFRVMIAPGSYPKGVKITICDQAHQMVSFKTKPLTLAAGDIHPVEMEYTPEADLVFYEGFDNMVWGGNIMKGCEGFGFAPTAEEVTTESSLNISGYEEAFAEVAYNNPGTGYIQPESWGKVDGLTVAESHRMTENYVMSRNIGDLCALFRAQEHPGYIAISTATNARGVFTTPNAAAAKSIGRVKASAQFALQSGYTGNLQVQAINGGVIESAAIDGVAIDLATADLTYNEVSSIITIPKKNLPIPTESTGPHEWHSLEVVINGATNGTRLFIADGDLSTGVHGIYLDAVEIRQLEEWGKKEGTLRVLLWNVQNGMWCDQHNNYDNFIKWVKGYDPDVCIWCEAESIYKSQPQTGSLNEADKILPNGWDALGRRYGHSFAEVGGNRDNYPQAITSKYEIKAIQKITDTDQANKPISHGAGHFAITVNGKKINFVTLHMWPQGYSFGIEGEYYQNADKAKNGGDYYREFEMKYIINNTVNHSNYAAEEYWVLGGDTNSRSKLDAWYHGYADNNTILLTHNVIRNQTNLKDVIGDYYPRNYFMTTTNSTARIDFLYASPKMYDRIDQSITLIDEWCRPRNDGNLRGFPYPSDHRPILVDFMMK